MSKQTIKWDSRQVRKNSTGFLYRVVSVFSRAKTGFQREHWLVRTQHVGPPTYLTTGEVKRLAI